MRAILLAPVALVVSGPAVEAGTGPEAPAPATRISGDELALRGQPAALVPPGWVPNLLGPALPGAGATGWSLRGLGNGPGPSPLAPAVGVFVDGVPLGEADGADFALFDLQSVDVTAGGWGVQGTGGALALSLAAPKDGFGGWVGAGWGAYDRKLARGGVNVPLGALTLNAAAFVSDDDGVARNRTTGEKVNDEDRAGLRLEARIVPAERLSLALAVAHVEDKGENVLAFACNPADPSACGGRNLTTGLTKARILGGAPQFGVAVAGDKADQRLGRLRATTLLTARLGWAGEAVQAELLSALRDSSESSGIDYADGRGLPSPAAPDPEVRGFVDGGLTFLTDRAVQQSSHALKLSGRIAGIGFEATARYQDTSDRLDIADLETGENATPAGEQRLLADRVARVDGRLLSGELRLDADAGPVRLEAGLGYVDEEQRLSLAETGCGPAGCLAPLLGGAVPERQDWSAWTPMVRAELKLGDGAQLFAGARRGYRPGGWNLRAVTASAFTAFGPETAWTYEAGAAADLFDRRLEARITGFAIRAQDRQASGAALLDGVPQATADAPADWRNQGVEVTLAARPVDGLALRLSLATQDARWQANDAVRAQQALCTGSGVSGCGVGIVRADGTLATPTHAPDFSVGGGAAWTIPVPVSGILLTPTVDLLWTSGYEIDVANLVDGPGGRLRVDAGLAVETDDRAWLLTLACRNCLDSDSADSSLFGWRYLEAPRSWQIVARRRF